MLNTLYIDTTNSCECTLVSSVDDKTARLKLNITSDITLNPQLEIVGGRTVDLYKSEMTVFFTDAEIQGTGTLQFRIVDDHHTGDYFNIKQCSVLDNTLYIKQIDNFNYELSYKSSSGGGTVDAYTKAETNALLAGKSDSGHNHNGTYATPAELNTAKNEVLQLANEYADTVGNGKANINGWTPSRVMCSNSKGELVPNSSVTTNELGYLNGVTSNIQTQINTINDDLKGLHHLTVKSSGVKTFSFKINITSRGAFMMFGELNHWPLLATGLIKVTDQTANCTTNPFDGGTITIDIQCTECDADGYSTVTVTFNRNIYGWIDILSSHPMLAA